MFFAFKEFFLGGFNSRQLPGYIASRIIRSMVFIDFDSIRNATSAMVKYQNFCFPGIDQDNGIAVDYDKDPTAKRNRAYEISMVLVTNC